MAGQVNTRVSPTITEILQGSGKITIDGIDVGSYQGGVKIEYGQQETFIDSEWALGHIDSEIKMVTMKVTMELEQATLHNLMTAYGIASSSVTSATSSSVVTIKPPTSMLEKVLVLEGMSATNRLKIRTYTFNKVVRVGSTGITLNRGVKTTCPISFECLMDANGAFGTYSDATI
jgi:hypothetical protein